MSTSVLKALPGKLDIKRHSPSIFYLSETKADASSDYVELPSKSTTASIDLSSNDDAIEIETSEIVKKTTTGHL